MKLLYLFWVGILILGPVAQTQAQPPDASFREQLAKYKDDGQWNLVIIHSQEWTRREPQNALAWNELSLAYSHLNQNGQALDAAKRALQLANKEPVLWSNLGYVHLTLNEPNAALKAFEEAVRWDPKDARSYTEIGILHLRFERDREAQYAFDKALEANAEYSRALCGEGVVALRQKRVNDAKAYVRRLKPVDRECADSLEKQMALRTSTSDHLSHDFANGDPASPRAIAAWKRFSNNIDARCESGGAGWDCVNERMRLKSQFYELVASGKIKL